MTLFIISQFLYLNHSQLENKMNYDNMNIIFCIIMVDLVGIDVHMSNILSLKSRLTPSSGHKTNYILLQFCTVVHLESAQWCNQM